MPLFTFSSNPLKLTVLFFMVIVIILGVSKIWLLNQVSIGLVPLSDSFWWLKTHNKNNFDVVVIGDSRVYRDISPSDMSSIFNGHTVFNFGYSSAGFSQVILEAGEEKLDPNGWNVIVLGVSPHTLTESAALNESYLQYKNKSRFYYYFSILNRIFGREETELALKILFGCLNKTHGYFQIPHPNGWIESKLIPEEPEKALSVYKKMFTQYKVSPRIQKELLSQVQVLKKKGITVFGFRPPSSKKMENLENEISGFDEDVFKKQFGQAGGTWIDIENRFGFISYDGSHLRSDSARLLSRYIAKIILKQMIAQQNSASDRYSDTLHNSK